jgi:hypothetical protein
MKKNLYLNFNHEEEQVSTAICVNGEPLAIEKPDFTEFKLAGTFLNKVCPIHISIHHLTEALLQSEQDGKDLAKFAFTIGFHVAKQCEALKENLMWQMRNGSANRTSEFIEDVYKMAIISRTKERSQEDAKEYASILASMTLGILLVMMQEMDERH